ncbi:hypothetical protein QE152_g36525 [Popillia japonica]|uniref:Uncharacterized protein n=1 Tax=Popillia japonica TaxID=7064 RepID=A0AAW1IDB0_POPJA
MTDLYCFAIAQVNRRTMADLVALCAKWMEQPHDLFERKKPAAKPSGAAAPAGPPRTEGPINLGGEKMDHWWSCGKAAKKARKAQKNISKGDKRKKRRRKEK